MKKNIIWSFLFLFILSLQGLAQEMNNMSNAFIGSWTTAACKSTCFELTISNENDLYILEGVVTTTNQTKKKGSFKLDLIDDNTLLIAQVIEDSIGDADQLIGTKIIREENKIAFIQPDKKSVYFFPVKQEKQ